MILWLNGPFGVGKTATARSLAAERPAWRIFDPETGGYMLVANLRVLDVADFQDLAAWRSLVPLVAAEVASLTAADLIAVQSVLSEHYWTELRAGMAEAGLDLFHVLLDCDEAALRSRIRADEVERGAEQWRLDHLAAYAAARPWLLRAAHLVIDTSSVEPRQAAARVLAALDDRSNPSLAGRTAWRLGRMPAPTSVDQR
jgi:hypothetical protein